MRYKATVMYDGTAYSGWQIQPNGVTIQEKLQQALFNLTRQETEIVGAGRTDSGVHALGQVFHFDCEKEFSDIVKAINSQLPDDIHVSECVQVADDFHARFDAEWKYYSYVVNTAEYNPLQRNYAWQLCEELDIDLMREAAELFVGEHDFTSFNATKLNEMENQTRTIFNFDISEKQGIVSFDIDGNGFMRHMIRMMVGTLVEVGRYRLSVNQVKDMLEARNKDAVHYNAPACGLYLVKIGYKEN